MAQIFLSYSRKDARTAKAVADGLARSGHEVWWDSQIRGGSRFASEIDRALQAADVVVVLWSKASIVSGWVLDEASEGRDSGRLLPVALDDCKPPLGFRQYQTISLAGSDGYVDAAALDRIVAEIADRVGAQPGQRPIPEAPREEPSPSVCILPFLNMSGDPEQDYFSDGITEDVITDLSQVSSLGVIARNTAFTFKGRTVDIRQVASELGVSHVLEGSVRKAGPRVRITAQLIEGSTAQHVWAERYDRDLTDIFAIQDEISHAIVDALQLKLLPREKVAIETRPTSSGAAYDLYLQARQLWTGGNFGNSNCRETVVGLCGEAVSLDSDYAAAWALKALAQADLRFWHGRDEDALLAAERAIAIDPHLAEPYCVRAAYLEEEGKPEDARRELDTALGMSPESWDVNRQAATITFRQGRIADAIPLLEAAVAAMKSDHHSASMLISCYTATGDRDGILRSAETAVARAERVIASDPGHGSAYASGAHGLAALGHEKRARLWIRKALNTDPGNLPMRYSLASTLASVLNDADSAFDVLEPFVEGAGSRAQLTLLEQDPDWASVRDLARFQRMVARAKQRVEALERTGRRPERVQAS